MRSFTVFIIVLLSAALLCACGAPVVSSPNADAALGNSITLCGSTAEYRGDNISVKGNAITISAPGEYRVSGTLDNGQIIVDTGAEDGKVFIFLDNADITCLTAPAIYVLQAKTLHLVAEKGTVNRIVSGTEDDLAAFDGSAGGGAVFSEDDIDIEGTGSIEIRGYINNGITCKDDVEIKGCSISVIAANNGIKGSESITVKGGTLSVKAGNDGLKTTSSSKEGKGFIAVSGGTISIDCEGDGISAETEFTVSSGTVNVVTHGDPSVSSCKAVKAKSGVVLSDGELNLTAPDHALHSSSAITVTGGSITAVSSVGKAIAAHEDISISGGTLLLASEDDGIETKTDVLVSGGSIEITSGHDAIKAGTKDAPAAGRLLISGGTVSVEAAADPADAAAGIDISGGSFIGLGAAKNQKGLSLSGTQGCISLSVEGLAGGNVSVDAGSFTGITAGRDFTFFVFSSPDLVRGSKYSVTIGSNIYSAVA